ncbi:MAG: hypothetical protein MEQ07_04675 [Aquimonas sp.]|nr:hypothetical protein [Aquimonas sp.]
MNSSSLGRTALCGFIAGALAYLVFHQGAFWALTQAGVFQANTWSMAPTQPLGVPLVFSAMFWTGLWGVLGAFLVARLSLPRWLGWMLFATVVVTLVNWFIVLPLKGGPVGGGFRMPGVVLAPLVYSLWGLGMWLIYSALQRPRGASPSPAR